MPTELQLKRSIDDLTLALIGEVHRAAASLGHQPLLVGATARIILVEHVFGLAAGRGTRDVDFAFALATWDQFGALRKRLIDQHGFAADTRVNNRLFYQSPGTAMGIPLDLLPFGLLAGEGEEVRWPPDMDIVMNVAGFADAFDSAVSVEVTPGLRVAIASLPAIATLKLFAWLARRRETSKDASDLTALLRLYHEVDPERVYSLPAEVLEDVEYNIELVGAWLLGSDARQSTLAPTAAKLNTFFADAVKTEHLIQDMARTLGTMPDPDAHAARLLAQFVDGFANAILS